MNENQAITPEALLAHQDFVRSLARSLLFDENQVDDVVQQAWMVALRRAPGQPGALRSWLAAVTRNLSHNHWRGEGRRHKHERRVPPRDLAPSASEIVQREEIRGRVVDAVLALAEPYRSTLVLRYLEELTPKEIAEKTGEPASTVRVRIKRGLAQLRQRLDRDMGGDRQAWMLALVPFAAAGGGAALVLGATGVGSLGKWAGAAALALALLGGWWVWDRSEEIEGGEVAEIQEGEKEISGETRRIEVVAAKIGSEEGSRERKLQDGKVDDLPRAAMAGFKGRLVGPGGKAIAGGIVRILSGDLNRKFYARLTAFGKRERAEIDSSETMTDSQGRFAFTGIWPESFYVLAAGRERQVTRRIVLDRVPAPGQVVDLGDVLLPRDPLVRGKIIMPNGKPAAGAWVWATEFPGPAVGFSRAHYFDPEAWIFDIRDTKQARAYSLDLIPKGLIEALPLAWTRTDISGQFELSLPAGRSFALVAHARGVQPYLRNRIRSRVGKDKDLGEIQLKSGESVGGMVVDAQGEPVGGAQVLVAPLPAIGPVPVAFAAPYSETDGEGRFVVGGMPRGAEILAAARRGPGGPWIFSTRSRVGDPLRFALPARFDLPVLIVDEQGRAIAEPRIRVFPGVAHAEEILLGIRRETADRGKLIAGDKKGEWVLRDLPRGGLTLLVGARGYVTQRRLFEDGKAKLPLRLMLVPATTVEVTVLAADGKRVRGATLLSRRVKAAEWTRPQFDLFRELQSSVLPIREGKTSSLGRLRIEDLPEGKVWITARHPLHGQISKLVHLPSRYQTLTFRETCVVEGRVDATALQLAEHPSMVHLWKVGGNDTKAMPNHPHLTVPDKEGRFRFSGVEPGRYIIQIHPSLSQARTLKGIYAHYAQLYWSNLATQRFALRPGEHKSVVMKWPHKPKKEDKPGNCSITGTFQVDGSMVDSSQLVVYGSTGNDGIRSSKVWVRNGRFSVESLHPGYIKLSFYTKAGSTPENLLLEHSLTLGEAQKLSLDFAVNLSTVSGSVVTSLGRRVPDAMISLHKVRRSKNGARLRRGMSRSVRCDAMGGFRVEGLPQGEYELLASGPEGHGWSWIQLQSSQSAPVEVRLRRGYTVSGFFRPEDWNWKRDKDHSYSVVLWHMQSSLELSGEVGEKDGFRIRQVPPGRYRIRVVQKRQIRGLAWTFGNDAGKFEVFTSDIDKLQLLPPKR